MYSFDLAASLSASDRRDLCNNYCVATTKCNAFIIRVSAYVTDNCKLYYNTNGFSFASGSGWRIYSLSPPRNHDLNYANKRIYSY